MSPDKIPIPLNTEDQKFLWNLFADNYWNLLKYAKSVGRGISGEDMVQETFLIASSRIEAVRASPNPGGWLMRTLQNLLRKPICKEIPLPPEEIFASQESYSTPAFESHMLLTESCRKYLSAEDWALLYKKSQGYTFRELANEYSLSESACKMRISRAKAILRSKII